MFLSRSSILNIHVIRKSSFSALPIASFTQFFVQKIAVKKRTNIEEKYDVKIDVKLWFAFISMPIYSRNSIPLILSIHGKTLKEVKRKSLFSALPITSYSQFFVQKIAAKKRTKVEEKYDVKIVLSSYGLPSLACQSSVDIRTEIGIK